MMVRQIGHLWLLAWSCHFFMHGAQKAVWLHGRRRIALASVSESVQIVQSGWDSSMAMGLEVAGDEQREIASAYGFLFAGGCASCGVVSRFWKVQPWGENVE